MIPSRENDRAYVAHMLDTISKQLAAIAEQQKKAIAVLEEILKAQKKK